MISINLKFKKIIQLSCVRCHQLQIHVLSFEIRLRSFKNDLNEFKYVETIRNIKSNAKLQHSLNIMF